MKGVGNVESGRVQDSFFGMSFNHQMSWIDETVSHIVTHNLQPKKGKKVENPMVKRATHML